METALLAEVVLITAALLIIVVVFAVETLDADIKLSKNPAKRGFLCPHIFRGIQAVADFRSRHFEYAASYINKQNGNARGNDTDVGTGGTPFMKYLKKHRDETEARLL